MQIKCAQKFRQWYKQLKPANNNDYYNENFIGSTHGETLGFFSLFHGDKDDIYSFLRKETEMAEDAQAIYEFVQNAADSNSTHFYMFYDDNYFMAINNGEMFTKEGVKSILNIGQSHGKVDNPDKIGRFGIGFKLVHRLVGKTSGLKELIDEYRGPQMYSWGRLSDFTNFANSSEFSGSEIESESPWLFKILITNFPASVDEVVKDINYKDRTVFPKSEVEEFQSFLRNNLPRIDQSVMKQGTIFFIKLGEGKNKQIKKDQDLINNRLQNCLYLLKDLEHIQINNEVVQRNPDFILEKSFVINPDEDDFKRIGLQEQRDLKYPFNLQFGYLPYTEESRDVIDYPNFYKFFPMEDTIYKLKFILHSNVFSIGSNRRHLHDDSINKELLELFSSKITERLDIYQTTDKNKYNTIFCNIITSECDNKFINEHFQDHLFNYCSENIPVSDCDDYMDASDVVIKKTDLNLHPSDFGLDKNWLLWSDGNSSQYKNLINKCKKDLGLKSYSLKDLLEEGNIEDINYWINSYGEDQYNIFLIELEKSIPKNIADIEFIRFDDCFYSLSELINKEDYIINFQLIEPIKEILENLNFNISLDSFDSYPNIRNAIGTYAPYIKDGEEKNLFDLKLKENLKENFLSPQEKEILFKTLMQFKNLGSITLSKELYLFKDVQGDIRPLCEMINPELIKEAWFENYSIDQDELFPELQKSEFLINERTLFNRIIQPDWTNITEDIDKYSINDFYICVQKYYNETENPLSLEGLDFVFTNCESFTDSNSIFYHKDLINFSEYSALSEIIEAGDYAIVPQNLLHFFNEKPFKIENSDLTDLFITSEYTQEAIDALLRFLSGKVEVFEHMYIDRFNSLFSINRADEDTLQYWSSKKTINEFIENYHEDKLILLPKEFAEYKSKCLRNEELITQILSYYSYEDLDTDEQIDILNLLKDSGLTDVPKQYLNEIEKFNFRSDSDDKYTDTILRLVLSLFSVDEIIELRSRIYIDDKSINILNSSDNIELEGFTIKLSNLSPSYEESKIIDLMYDRYKNDEHIDQHKLKKLLDSNSSISDDEWVKITESIIEEESGELRNGDQLLVMLIMHKRNLVELSDLKIADIEDDYQGLNSGWYFNDFKFISNGYILNPKYDTFRNQYFSNPSFFSNNEYQFLSKPYTTENEFICPGLLDKEPECLTDLLDYLERERTNKKSNLNWVVITDFIENSFDVNFRGIILDKLYAIEDENLEDELQSWLKQNNGVELLGLLGAQTSESVIVRFRKALKNNKPKTLATSDFREMEALSEEMPLLVLNTLYYLEKEEIVFSEDIAKLLCSWMKNIDLKIIKTTTPLIYIKERLNMEFSYLVKMNDDSEYLFTHDFLEKLKEIGELNQDFNSDTFIDHLIESGVNLIDEDTVPEGWYNFDRLEFVDPIIDEDFLESGKEWDSLNYINWKKELNTNFEIILLPSKPLQVYHIDGLDETFSVKTANDLYYWDEEESKLYIPKDHINDAILAFSQNEETDLTVSDFVKLLVNSSSLINSPMVPKTEHDNLLAEVERLREKIDYLTRSEADVTRGGVNIDYQIAANEDLRNQLKEALQEDSRFDCSDWDIKGRPSSVVHGVKYLNNDCIFIVRSCVGAKLHLTPYEWTLMNKPNTFLAIKQSDEGIYLYGIDKDIRDQILDNNSTINLNFDLMQISKQAINGLMKLLSDNYVLGSGLVFNAPDSTIGSKIETLSNLNWGSAFDKFTENDI